MPDAQTTNWRAMADAALMLREFAPADASAREIIALHLEAAGATVTSMIDVIDQLCERKPHLLAWSPVANTAPGAPTSSPEPDSGYTGLTARMIALKKSQQQ